MTLSATDPVVSNISVKQCTAGAITLDTGNSSCSVLSSLSGAITDAAAIEFNAFMASSRLPRKPLDVISRALRRLMAVGVSKMCRGGREGIVVSSW